MTTMMAMVMFVVQELIKANEDTMMNADLVRIHKQAIDKLRKEINDFRVEAIKQRKLIFHLERMRNDQIEQASKLTAKVGVIRLKRLYQFHPPLGYVALSAAFLSAVFLQLSD